MTVCAVFTLGELVRVQESGGDLIGVDSSYLCSVNQKRMNNTQRHSPHSHGEIQSAPVVHTCICSTALHCVTQCVWLLVAVFIP